MRKNELSNVGKIFLLLRGIHIPPVYFLAPFGLSILSAIFEGVGMGLLIPILNGFFQKSFAFLVDVPILGAALEMLPLAVRQNDKLLFGVLLIGFIAVYILKNIIRYLSAVSVYYFGERSLHHLRKILFTRYLSFGKLFFDTTNVGHHSTLLMEFSRLALYPVLTVDRFINALFSLSVYFILMLMISWKLTVLALPLFFLLHIAIRVMISRVQRISHSLAERGSELGKKSIEILSTIPLVKASRTEDREQRHFARISDEKARLDFRVNAVLASILPFQETITLLAGAAIFAGALALIGRDQIASAPAVLVFFYVVMNSSQKFGALSGFRGTIASASGPMDAVLDIFDEHGKFFVKGGDKIYTGLTQGIRFSNLTFGYSDDRMVLKNLSCVMKKGEMTAIVGPTGAGKSTLISLLMRYYDCPPASIFLDDTDIREFNLDDYLGRVALVSQETLLLHDSLRNNITYGLRGITDKDLLDVLRRARLQGFVDQLSEGLDTLIGDRGVKLSGGEKQRVSIARALLKGADILVLDEATSSLDSQTEKLIQEAIDEAVTGRTSIVIAHRLSTIKHADKIIVLDNGVLAEEGTLDALLERRGLFSRLWEEQRF